MTIDPKKQLQVLVSSSLLSYYYKIEEYLNSKEDREEMDKLKHKLLELKTQTLKELFNED